MGVEVGIGAVVVSTMVGAFTMMLKHVLKQNSDLSKRIDALVNNHLSHNTAALTSFTSAVIDLRNAIQTLARR